MKIFKGFGEALFDPNRVGIKLTPTATVSMFAAGFALICRRVTGIGLKSQL